MLTNFFFLQLSRELKEPSIDLENAVLHIVQKILNSIPTTRIVYRQEAMMEIAKLPLTTCSEQLVPVYAIGYYRIGKTLSSHSLMSQYAHRKNNHNQSFVQFFLQQMQLVQKLKAIHNEYLRFKRQPGLPRHI